MNQNRKIFLLIVLSLISIYGFSQKIELIEEIAFIDKIKYVKVEKINRKKFVIRNIDTNEEILRIKLFKSYNSLDKRTHKLPQIFFVRIKKTMDFETDIQSELELVKFLYNNEIVFLDGKPNEKKVFAYLDFLKKLREQNDINQN